MSDSTKTEYTHGKLFLAIVRRGEGERLVAINKRAGARGGTILLGRGAASSNLFDFLGIGDTEQDIIMTIAPDESAAAIMRVLREHEFEGRSPSGVIMQIDVSHFLRHIQAKDGALHETATSPARRSPMENKADHILITFIVNRGYADDAMSAARKAGATGGTVLNARGTGKEEDVKFFGISLVPEKDVLLVLVDAAKASSVLSAVQSLSCLAEPGSGIAFSIEVEDFVALGKNAK